jgi:hypothetical protein
MSVQIVDRSPSTVSRRLEQDLGGWQDDHAEKDLEESQRGSGQDDPACRCPLEREGLLGRDHQSHICSEDTLGDDTPHIDDSLVPHQYTRVSNLGAQLDTDGKM